MPVAIPPVIIRSIFTDDPLVMLNNITSNRCFDGLGNLTFYKHSLYVSIPLLVRQLVVTTAEWNVFAAVDGVLIAGTATPQMQ